MKHTIVLVFLLFNILIISCANKSNDTEKSTNENNYNLKLTKVLNKKFNLTLKLPTVEPPQLSQTEQSSNNSIIKGKTEGNNIKTIYLHEITREKLIFIDSVKVDNEGNFLFNISKFNSPTICFITLNSKNPPGIPVIIGEKTKLSISIKNEGWITYKVSGDKENLLINELYSIYLNHDKNLQDFNREVSEIDPSMVTDSLRTVVGERFKSMQKSRTDNIAAFINSKEGCLALYFAVTFLFEEPDISLMEAVYQKLNKKMPNSKYTKELKIALDSISPLEIGGVAPDLELADFDGKMIKLSSLRGKVVLIDFWASWCGPCRRENPNVVKLYNNFKNKGFEIYGVSLDENGDKWKAAVSNDGLSWIHVSDLKGWQSIASRIYQVSSIPYTVLLDKSGRIIAKGLRGSELEAKLAEILK
ncbi:MAG: AhpC/TSA family protein [Bacteroidia bacterium]|nr:AhpC/TSA family protein [Bacteroidia bacterium]